MQQMEEIIGREEEKKILNAALVSKEAELIAVYGRRRIGKTYLIRNFYQKNIRFELTGIHQASLKIQLQNFSLALQSAMSIPVLPAQPNNWISAFQMLSEYIKTVGDKEPIVILFDELPWLCTPKSGFLQAFGHWWNTSASRQSFLKVVICGSAASWIIRNVINDRGGLHNRVTSRIRLLPFTLVETEKFLLHNGVKLDRYQILQLYMAMGGVPQYLKQIQKGESASQSIDKLFFSKNGLLKTEFADLYRSLFAHAENHEAIVRALSRKAMGMTRAEIIDTCGFTTGGWTSELFDELEQSGFITQYIPFSRTVREAIYKLSDEYSLFYLKFIEGARVTGTGSWHRISQSHRFMSWSGFAFEAICQKHLDAIKNALGISGVYTESSGWRGNSDKGSKGAQVDLLLDRADHCINLCEMKFSSNPFVIDKKYAGELDTKVSIFQSQTRTRKTIFPTMITTFGTMHNQYYTGRIVSEVSMQELFK
jgi:uncharacterized protein